MHTTRLPHSAEYAHTFHCTWTNKLHNPFSVNETYAKGDDEMPKPSNWKRVADKMQGKRSEDCFGDYSMCYGLRRKDWEKCERKQSCREENRRICLELLAH